MDLIARPSIAAGLLQPDVAIRQDGVFTRAQARAAGYSDDRQRGLIARGVWVPLAGPALRHSRTEVGPWQRARAVALLGRHVVSHATAGQLWGLAAPDELHGSRRSGRPSRLIRDHHTVLGPPDVMTVGGLQATVPDRTLADLMCSLSLEQCVHTVTDALRRGLLTPDDLVRVALASRGRTGAAQARLMARTCHGTPFSPLEWWFHGLARRVCATGWRFNVEVRDSRGVIGIVDAIHDASGVVVELDGRQFHGPERFQADRSRDQRLVAAGYVVLRFTWDDLSRRAAEVEDTLRQALRRR